jgi:hypothetical protein
MAWGLGCYWSPSSPHVDVCHHINEIERSKVNSIQMVIQSAKSLRILKTRFPHNHYGLNLWTTRPNDLPARNAVLKPIVKTSSNYTRKTVPEFEASFLTCACPAEHTRSGIEQSRCSWPVETSVQGPSKSGGNPIRARCSMCVLIGFRLQWE